MRQKLLKALPLLLLICVAAFCLGPSPDVRAGADQGRAGGRAPRKRVLAWADSHYTRDIARRAERTSLAGTF